MQLKRSGVDALRRAAAFRSLSDADCAAVLVCSRGRWFAKGEVVYQEGDPGSYLVLVSEGLLVATSRVAGGGVRELGRVGVGEAAGALGFLDSRRREATVTAAEETAGYEIDYDSVEVLLRNAPSAACAVLSLALGSVAKRLRRLGDRIGEELGP
jgi:CRP-like cAMP-binding protein